MRATVLRRGRHGEVKERRLSEQNFCGLYWETQQLAFKRLRQRLCLKVESVNRTGVTLRGTFTASLPAMSCPRIAYTKESIPNGAARGLSPSSDTGCADGTKRVTADFLGEAVSF